MLCPLDVMGQLVALQGDHSLLIRREALRLVQLEDEKHPTFLDNRLLEGVELTYAFQMRVLGETRPVDEKYEYDENDGSGAGGGAGGGAGLGQQRDKGSVFGPLYVTCIQGNKKRRTDFIVGLLRRALQVTNTSPINSTLSIHPINAPYQCTLPITHPINNTLYR